MNGNWNEHFSEKKLRYEKSLGMDDIGRYWTFDMKNVNKNECLLCTGIVSVS